MTPNKTGEGVKLAARTRTLAHPPPGASTTRFLHLSPAASPPTCSLAAGLEGQAPGYPALGKEILRPCPENLGRSRRKKINEQGPGPQEGPQKHVETPRLQFRLAQSAPAQSVWPLSPNLTSPPVAWPLQSATHPYSPSHRRPLFSKAMAASLRPLRVPKARKYATQVQRLAQ